MTGVAVEPERAQLDTLGLNHLTWHRGLTIDGEDVWPQIIDDYLAELRSGCRAGMAAPSGGIAAHDPELLPALLL